MRVLFQAQELKVISAAEDGEIRVWDLLSQQCKATLKASLAIHAPAMPLAKPATLTTILRHVLPHMIQGNAQLPLDHSFSSGGGEGDFQEPLFQHVC
jgi:hypothetical protein